MLEAGVLLLVGPLHAALELVAGGVEGPGVGHEGTDLIEALDHLLVLADDLVAADEAQLVLLQLAGSDDVGEVARTEEERGGVLGDGGLGLLGAAAVGAPQLGRQLAVAGLELDPHQVVEVLRVGLALQPQLVLLHRKRK